MNLLCIRINRDQQETHEWGKLSLALTLVLFAAVALLAQDSRTLQTGDADQADWLDCGLHKLTQSELSHLMTSFGAGTGVSFVESAALAYVREKGIEPIQILGAVRSGDSEPLRLVAMKEYEAYLLEPLVSAGLLEPGRYLAQATGSRWTIINARGGEEAYWATD